MFGSRQYLPLWICSVPIPGLPTIQGTVQQCYSADAKKFNRTGFSIQRQIASIGLNSASIAHFDLVGLHDPSIFFSQVYIKVVHQLLQVGETLDLSTVLRATYAQAPGVYRVSITVDAAYSIIEQNEDDNTTWVTHKNLYVGPRPTDTRSWTLYR